MLMSRLPPFSGEIKLTHTFNIKKRQKMGKFTLRWIKDQKNF